MARHRYLPHPVTALFAVLLLFASLYLPPYKFDPDHVDHWFPFVAAATGIRHGLWPYIGGYDSGYGLLCPAFLAAWIAGFGLSALSLSALVMLCNLVAGAAAFALIRMLTASRVVALVGALYPLQGVSEYALMGVRAYAVSSSFRAPVQIAVCALLLYLSLRDRPRRIVPAFLFGLAVLWNPPFGAFAAAGFLLAHGWLMLGAGSVARSTHLRVIGAMLAGIGLPLAIAWAGGAVVTNPVEIYRNLSASGALFLFGYANASQKFDPIVVVAFLVGVLYVTLILRRWLRSRRPTRRTVFVGASLVAAIPYVLYALGHSDPLHYWPAYWALMPSAAFLFYLFARAKMLRTGARPGTPRSIGASSTVLSAAALAGVIAVAYAWGWFPLDRTLSIKNFSAGYQLAKAEWRRECLSAPACDLRNEPALRDYLKQASQTLWDAGRLGFDPALLRGCRDGLVILSYADAWIYATAGCHSPLRIASAAFMSTQREYERMLELLRHQQQIVVDPMKTGYAYWKGDILADMKASLISHGFRETAGCGRFSVLSKTDPAAVMRRLCDSAQPPVVLPPMTSSTEPVMYEESASDARNT